MAQFGRNKQADTAAPAAPPEAETPSQEVATRPDTAPVPISADIIVRIREAVQGIPESDGEGAESIIRQLLDAQTIDDLNAPWEGSSGRSLAGKRLTIRGCHQRPSSFEDGAGIFLVVDAADAKTGESLTFTTSAVSVVLQLARAWSLGLFPLIADVVVAERPTARGFYPYHLRIIAAGSKEQS